MLSVRKYALFFLLTTMAALIAACASHEVRHLASDASLVAPGQTSQQQILGLLGPPDQKEKLAQGGELWRYYQANKSLLRKTPYIGDHLGYEKYDVLTITFRDQRVVECVYRQLDEEDFAKLGIDAGAAAEK